MKTFCILGIATSALILLAGAKSLNQDAESRLLKPHFLPTPKETIDFGPEEAEILEHKFENDGSGNYNFAFATADLKRFEVGELKNAGTDNEAFVVRGKYIDTVRFQDGSLITREIGYIADENGFRPFLLRISPIEQVPILRTGGYSAPLPGAPDEDVNDRLSGAALSSLIGGNLG